MTTIAVAPEQKLKYGMFAYVEGASNPLISYNDIVLDAQGENIVLFDKSEAIQTVARSAVLTQRGELQYNVNKGIPYIGTIFSDSNLIPLWRSYMEEAISAISEVREVQYFEIDFNRAQSSLSYRCGFTTDYGKAELNERYL